MVPTYLPTLGTIEIGKKDGQNMPKVPVRYGTYYTYKGLRPTPSLSCAAEATHVTTVLTKSSYNQCCGSGWIRIQTARLDPDPCSESGSLPVKLSYKNPLFQ